MFAFRCLVVSARHNNRPRHNATWLHAAPSSTSRANRSTLLPQNHRCSTRWLDVDIRALIYVGGSWPEAEDQLLAVHHPLRGSNPSDGEEEREVPNQVSTLLNLE